MRGENLYCVQCECGVTLNCWGKLKRAESCRSLNLLNTQRDFVSQTVPAAGAASFLWLCLNLNFLTTSTSNQSRTFLAAQDQGYPDHWGKGVQMLLCFCRDKTKRVQLPLCDTVSVLVGGCVHLWTEADCSFTKLMWWPHTYFIKAFWQINIGMNHIFPSALHQVIKKF